MGYVPRRSAPRLPQGTSAPEGTARRRKWGQEQLSGRTAEESALKSSLVFNPCENSEQTKLFVLQSIRNSDAPNGKHSTPPCLVFHGSA